MCARHFCESSQQAPALPHKPGRFALLPASSHLNSHCLLCYNIGNRRMNAAAHIVRGRTWLGGMDMVRIVIVEDDPEDLGRLMDCLHQFEAEQGERFSVKAFSNPSDFLDSYRLDCDLVFMDIELPLFNGVDAARQLREMDSVVTLIFITNMEQYAVNGYEVDALDFVVKPINYYRFSSMLRKALRTMGRRSEKEVTVQTAGSITRLRVSQIHYVEIRDHLLIYSNHN